MLMVEIEDRLHNLKQGVRSVMDYVAELKSFGLMQITVNLSSCRIQIVLLG